MSFLVGPISAVRDARPRGGAARVDARSAMRVKARLAPRPATRLSTLRVGRRAAVARRRQAGRLLARRIHRSRHGHADQHRPGQRLRADRRRPRPRLDQPQQPARVGARLRRLRRAPRRRQRAALRRHGQSPRRARRRARSAASTSPPTPGSSARCTTPPTTACATTTSRRCRRSRADAFDEAFAALERARRENALERSRRFDDAPLTQSAEAGAASRRGALGQPGAAAARVRPLHQRHLHRRPARADARPAPRSPRLPGQLRPDARHQPRRARAHPGGGRAGGRRHQPRVLLLVGRQRDVRLRHQAAAQRHRPDRRDERPPERPAHRAAAADGGDCTSRCGCCSSSMRRRRRCWPWPDGSPRSPSWSSIAGCSWSRCIRRPATMAVFEGRRLRARTTPAPTLLPVVERSPDWHMRTREFVPPALVRSALPEVGGRPGHHAPRGRREVASA